MLDCPLPRLFFWDAQILDRNLQSKLWKRPACVGDRVLQPRHPTRRDALGQERATALAEQRYLLVIQRASDDLFDDLLVVDEDEPVSTTKTGKHFKMIGLECERIP